MKKFLHLFIVIIISAKLSAQSQGPNNPANAVDPVAACLSCPGAQWTSIPNVMLGDNNMAYVVLQPQPSCSPGGPCFYSRNIYASNFGFTIPPGATILGILAEVRRTPGNPNTVGDSTVMLSKTGLPVGNDYSLPGAWPNVLMYASYGSGTDLWGATWTPAEINASTFGMFFKIYNMTTTITATVGVDHMRITVYYSTATGIYSQTSSSDNLLVFGNSENLTAAFNLKEETPCQFSVINILGNEILKNNLGTLAVGKHEEIFSVNSFSPGIYFVKLRAGELTEVKKIIVQK